MMDDLPFRARAIWDSDCGIVLLDGQRQVVSVIVRMLYSSMIVVQGIFVVYAEGPRVPRDMWNKSHRGAWAYGHRTHNKFPRSVLFRLGYIATIHDYYLNDNSSILFSLTMCGEEKCQIGLLTIIKYFYSLQFISNNWEYWQKKSNNIPSWSTKPQP